jgi:hypothetical protein
MQYQHDCVVRIGQARRMHHPHGSAANSRIRLLVVPCGRRRPSIIHHQVTDGDYSDLAAGAIAIAAVCWAVYNSSRRMPRLPDTAGITFFSSFSKFDGLASLTTKSLGQISSFYRPQRRGVLHSQGY